MRLSSQKPVFVILAVIVVATVAIFSVTTSQFQSVMHTIGGSLDKNYENSARINEDPKIAALASKVRVLVFVKTSPPNHQVKAINVQNTWAKRFDKVLFFTEQNDSSLHEVVLTNLPVGRGSLTAKVLGAFSYIYKHHFDDADWFMEADDDTYVIVENLRYFLATQDTKSPVYFGHGFATLVRQGYSSGGSGYVISKEALRRFGQRQPGQCGDERSGIDDVVWGECMQALGVKLGDDRDEQGRRRFHSGPLEHYLHLRVKDLYSNDKYQVKPGITGVSPYAVSFHYVTPDRMLEIDALLYHLKRFNLNNNQQ